MKLHLPKLLLTAVMAAGFVSTSVWGSDEASASATYELSYKLTGARDGQSTVQTLNDNFYIHVQKPGDTVFLGTSNKKGGQGNPEGYATVTGVKDTEKDRYVYSSTDKIYEWVTRNKEGGTTQSVNLATDNTTITVKYDGEKSSLFVDLNNSGTPEDNIFDAYLEMTGEHFDYDKMVINPNNNGVTISDAFLKVTSGTLAQKSWITSYEVAATAGLNITSTITGSLTVAGGATLVVSSLEALTSEYVLGDIDYSESGSQKLSVNRVVCAGSTDVTSVFIGSTTGSEVAVTNGRIDNTANEEEKYVYVVGNGETLTIGNESQPEGVDSMEFFALADTGTLTIAGAFGNKSAGTVLSETIGTGIINVQCAAGDVSGLNSDFSGSLTISNGGSLKVTGARALADTDIKVTGVGSTLEVAVVDGKNGALSGANVILGAGALLKKGGADNWADENQIHVLTLEGNATIENSSRFGLVATGTDTSTTLALGEHTLTKKGEAGFIMVNTTITGTGTIKTENGALMIGYSGAAGATTVSGVGATIDLGTGKTGDSVAIESSGSTLKVAGLINGSGASVANAGTIELHGTGTYNLDATVTGAGKLKVEGAGVHTLSGANTYTGGTYINAGTVKANNASALGTGEVSVAAGANLELGKDLEVSVSNLSIEKGGSLIFGNGTTLTVSGTLTLDASAIKFAEGFNFSTDEAMTLATASTLDVTGVDSWKGEYTIGGKEYTAGLSAVDNVLSLTFTELLPPSTDPITSTVTSVSSFADGVLTLNVTVGEDGTGKFASAGDFVLVNILTEDIMEGITTAVGSAKFFEIVLTDGTTEIKGGDNYNVGFLSENGCYYGEQVQLGNGNVAWQYSVEQIPEPTTATLSLLALMGLAARRRRQK